MLKKSLLTLALAAAAAAQAQPLANQPAPAQAPAQQAPQASTPAKKELAARILKAQQTGIENMARGLVEQPASELLGMAGQALPTRIAKDKQDAVAKDIQSDAQKYIDDTVPVVQKRALALAPTTIGTLLEERFSEDELRQIAQIMESPVFGKFQSMAPELQRALVERVVADTRPTVEPRVRALEASIGKRLGVSPPPGADTGAPAGKAPAGKAPAKKQ
jgi:hypothetical protein